MKNGRMLAAAEEKHTRALLCIGWALAAFLFCNGCISTFHSTSFDVKPKPASSISSTNFRLETVSSVGEAQGFEANLKAELQKLEKQQDQSLVAVPYSVQLRHLGYEETPEGTKYLTGFLFVASAFVLPHWDSTTHKWEISTILPGETASFRGEKSSTDVISWFMLPLGIRNFFGSGPGTSSLSEPMAKAIFDTLTQERYDKALQAMEKDAKQRLRGGNKLSATDERLLENDHSPEALAAWAKHPKNTQDGLAALRQVEDPEALADIALHASLPEIRQAAAERVSGLSELRFAELAVSSADDFVADTFVGRISDDTLLHSIVRTPAASKTTKMAAIWKIRQESVLSAIAKSPDGQSDLQELAVGRIGAESVLADVAAHAPNAKVRLAAIEKIGDPALLLASVAKDQEQKNRLAALDRISHPKALAAIMRKSGDAEVRLQAVRKITDPAVLQETVAGDADADVRLAALKRVSDQEVFARAAETDSSPEVRAAAIGKLAAPAMLAKIAKESPHEANRLAAVAKIKDDAVIGDIAQTDPSGAVRAAAVAKTGNQQVLARIARSDTASSVRLRAVQELRDQDCLATVARQDAAADVRKEAAAKIDDPVLLAALAKQDADATVRRTALARVNDQSALAEIAKRDPDAENRKRAILRLDDETVLRDIALSDGDQAVRNEALQKLPESSKKAILGSLARNALARGKQAKEDGLIDFCGFYVGMPLEDFNVLKEYYGLQEDECSAKTVRSSPTVAELHFSLGGIRRVTGGGNSFEELAIAVALHIGYMEPKFRQERILQGPPITFEYYEYETINGNQATLYETGTFLAKQGLTICGGEHLEKFFEESRKREDELMSAWGKPVPVLDTEKKTAEVLGRGKTAGETKVLELPGGTMMEMVWCPPGSFKMGSPKNEAGRDGDEKQHDVTLTGGFWIAKYEVTQAQWMSVMGGNPSRHKGDNLPVESIDWFDGTEFCRKTGLRLPTEAQWEYACRAGTTGPYSGTGVLDAMGWFQGNSHGQPHPVGRKQPNAWGVYDMHGNVAEWCADRYGHFTGEAMTNPVRLPNGKGRDHRVHRGGSYREDANGCRSAHRWGVDGFTSSECGVRPCCVP